MAIWRKFIPGETPTGARQYNNAPPHHPSTNCIITSQKCVLILMDNLCDNHLGRLADVMFDVTRQNFWGGPREDSSQHCDSSPLSSKLHLQYNLYVDWICSYYSYYTSTRFLWYVYFTFIICCLLSNTVSSVITHTANMFVTW